MQKKLLLVGFLAMAGLMLFPESARAHRRGFSFGFSFGFGGGHSAYYYPGYMSYGFPGYYYRPYYYPAPVVTYVVRPYRYRVYRTHVPGRGHYNKYDSYTPRRYYRKTYYRD